MKMIVAIIRPEKLEAVQAALAKRDLSLTSVSQVIGGSSEPGYTEIYRGRTVHVPRPKVRLEMIVDDYQVEAAVGAVVHAGATGLPGAVGDGKVFVMPLDECVGIHT